MTDEETIAALRAERRGYVARKLSDRVRAVDAELARFGVQEEAHSEPGKRGPGRPSRADREAARS